MYRVFLVLLFLMPAIWSDVKSTTGQIKFDVQNDGQSEMTLNSTGLGIGTTPSTNLHVNGNTVVSEQIFVGGSSGSSNLNIHGTISHGLQSVTTSTTLSGNSIVLVDTSAGNVVLSLPDAESIPGRVYRIKKTSPLNKVFVRDGGFIDQSSDVMLSTNSMGSLGVISASGNWSILNIQGNGMSIASENLVGWWTLNETSGTTASDSSLYNRNSTLTGSLSFSSNSISAVLDKGLDFNGTDYVAIDSDADLPLGNEDRTIMAWINVSAYTGTMLTWGTESGGQRNEFGLRSGNKVVFAVNGCAYGTSSTPGVGAWYHAAIVFSGTHVSDVKIYINGDSKTVSIQAGADRTVNTVSNGVMQIGTDIDRTDHYDGDMDDIRIYNRVLSATEIQAIYQQGQ